MAYAPSVYHPRVIRQPFITYLFGNGIKEISRRVRRPVDPQPPRSFPHSGVKHLCILRREPLRVFIGPEWNSPLWLGYPLTKCLSISLSECVLCFTNRVDRTERNTIGRNTRNSKKETHTDRVLTTTTTEKKKIPYKADNYNVKKLQFLYKYKQSGVQVKNLVFHTNNAGKGVLGRSERPRPLH